MYLDIIGGQPIIKDLTIRDLDELSNQYDVVEPQLHQFHINLLLEYNEFQLIELTKDLSNKQLIEFFESMFDFYQDQFDESLQVSVLDYCLDWFVHTLNIIIEAPDIDKNHFIEKWLTEKIEIYTKRIDINNKLQEITPKIVEANIEQLHPQTNSENESRTRKVIFETIANIDKQGWQYAFVSEQDYNLFTDLLTNFFEYKPYTLPKTVIQLKRTCKTKLAKVLGDIHKELSNENKLSTDTKYFQLVRVLNHFEKETEGDLYKALTR
jgi:hypothetical protein